MPLEKEAVLLVHHFCTRGHSCFPYEPKNSIFSGYPPTLLVLSNCHQLPHYKMLSPWRSSLLLDSGLLLFAKWEISSLHLFWFLRCFSRLNKILFSWRTFATNFTHLFTRASLNPCLFSMDIGVESLLSSHFSSSLACSCQPQTKR